MSKSLKNFTTVRVRPWPRPRGLSPPCSCLMFAPSARVNRRCWSGTLRGCSGCSACSITTPPTSTTTTTACATPQPLTSASPTFSPWPPRDGSGLPSWTGARATTRTATSTTRKPPAPLPFRRPLALHAPAHDRRGRGVRYRTGSMRPLLASGTPWPTTWTHQPPSTRPPPSLPAFPGCTRLDSRFRRWRWHAPLPHSRMGSARSALTMRRQHLCAQRPTRPGPPATDGRPSTRLSVSSPTFARAWRALQGRSSWRPMDRRRRRRRRRQWRAPSSPSVTTCATASCRPCRSRSRTQPTAGPGGGGPRPRPTRRTRRMPPRTPSAPRPPLWKPAGSWLRPSFSAPRRSCTAPGMPRCVRRMLRNVAIASGWVGVARLTGGRRGTTLSFARQGLPTHDAQGQPLSATQRKRLAKKLAKHAVGWHASGP